MPIISGWRGMAWRQRTTKFGLQIVINTTGRGAHTRLCNEETFKTRKRFIKGRIMKHTNTRNKERKRRREGGSFTDKKQFLFLLFFVFGKQTGKTKTICQQGNEI